MFRPAADPIPMSKLVASRASLILKCVTFRVVEVLFVPVALKKQMFILLSTKRLRNVHNYLLQTT